MTFAWTLALMPIMWLLMDVLLLQVVSGDFLSVSAMAALGANSAMAVMDSKALAKVGVRVSAWWGILLLPVYLILRTKRARSTAAIPIVWFVLVVAYVAASTPLLTALEEAGYSASSSPASVDGLVDDAWSDPLATYDCDDLADEAVAISADGSGIKLLKVRGLSVLKDNTSSYSLPSGAKEELVLACNGTGVWSDGDTNTKVRLELTVDADGDSWIAYEPAW